LFHRVLNPDGLGRVEGLIRRTSSNGLDVAIVSTAIKRERLAQRLEWLVRMALAKVNDQRKYERDETRQGQDIAISIRGEVCKCQIVDESPSGMALRIDSKPPIGTYVFVDGSSKVRPWQIRRLRPEKLKLRELIRATLAPNEQRPADVRRRHRIGHDAI